MTGQVVRVTIGDESQYIHIIMDSRPGCTCEYVVYREGKKVSAELSTTQLLDAIKAYVTDSRGIPKKRDSMRVTVQWVNKDGAPVISHTTNHLHPGDTINIIPCIPHVEMCTFESNASIDMVPAINDLLQDVIRGFRITLENDPT